MRVRRMTVAAAAAVLALLGGTSPATAGGTATDPSAPATVPRNAPDDPGGSVEAGKSGSDADAQAVIRCTGQVQRPHNSTHVPGTVNVVVTVSCTAPVQEITTRAALYKNGQLVNQSALRTQHNTASAQNNAAVRCSPGNYRGWMYFKVVFPPGYNPPTASANGFGQEVPISC
ncbi:hypothetical protein [Streptomyces albireticuli]|nr:hypothetical protein [Streptomyces albireticuli]MCD9141135.1 hypothetical protein [Streptomyces albireticuli]MCD9160904.1 hypothetical protein [Streptomyces albireticuli]MCD9191039.1 hypothetical protein [Streptomyces albireticuli]